MRRTVLLLLAVALLALPGCVAVAAGAAAGYGTSRYVRNDDVRDYAAGFSAVWTATLASMKDAGYPVATDATATATQGALAVNDATVNVWQVAENLTRVRIRIGTFSTDAHRRVSAQIHDGIAQRTPPR